MQEDNSNYVGFGCFFFLVVLIILGCSIVLYNEQKFKFKANDLQDSKGFLNEKIKKDKNKDFVFFTLEENISEQLQVVLKKANINIDIEESAKINEVLGEIYDEALLSVKKSDDNERVCENQTDIYSYISLDYAMYYNNYITLLISESGYNCNEEIEKPYKLYAYSFDSVTGEYKTFNDLLIKHNLTYTEVLEKVKKNLEEQQLDNGNEENIKIEDTLNSLKENENYVIYLSETNKLVMKYIVKTNTVDYNDVIELN